MDISLTDPEKNGALQIHDIDLIKTGFIKLNRIQSPSDDFVWKGESAPSSVARN
jgi:hypothetical protein